MRKKFRKYLYSRSSPHFFWVNVPCQGVLHSMTGMFWVLCWLFKSSYLLMYFNTLWMICYSVIFQKSTLWVGGNVKNAEYSCGDSYCTPTSAVILGSGISTDCCLNTDPDSPCNKAGAYRMSVIVSIGLTLVTSMVALNWRPNNQNNHNLYPRPWHLLHCGLPWHLLHCSLPWHLHCGLSWHLLHCGLPWHLHCGLAWHLLHCGLAWHLLHWCGPWYLLTLKRVKVYFENYKILLLKQILNSAHFVKENVKICLFHYIWLFLCETTSSAEICYIEVYPWYTLLCGHHST